FLRMMPSTELASTAPQSHLAGRLTVVCPDCRSRSSSLVQDFGTGDLVCMDCNAAVGDRLIESRSEWRPHVRRAQQIEDTKLFMSAARYALQGSSAPLPAVLERAKKSRTRSQAGDLQHEQSAERSVMQISALCAAMDVPRTIENAACEFYSRVEAGGLHRGKNSDAILATCVFLACRQQAEPRTFKEICALARVPRKDIGRTFKFLKEKLGAATAMSSDDLMARFCASLSLLSTAQECAILLNRMAKEHGSLAGKSPVSVAGACIYMASHLVGQPRDARIISHVAGVSEVTIKNSYKLLYADRALLLSPQVLTTDPAATPANLPVP
ncbi:transcription initiation factor IIB, partial [Coemansia sp. RSA 2322]